MIRTRCIAGFLCFLTFCPIAQAQMAQDQACGQQVYDALAKKQRAFRVVLFGQKKSADLPNGSVRYDKAGDPWVKKTMEEEGIGWQWATINGDKQDDDKMDETAEFPEARGIFEIRRATTSELIPALTQSLRALQCNLHTVCDAAAKSLGATNDDLFTVQQEGCISFQTPPYKDCKKASQVNIGAASCDAAVESIMAQEIELLKVTVAYDAAYRTMLQFAGTFEGFLTEFRFPLIQPLWQMLRAAGSLAKMPCFLAQCDE